MTTIAAENAKQIRRSMDVLITMQVPDDIDLTYTWDRTAVKISDPEAPERAAPLGQSSWPMWAIADLQGDGFPLDGSRRVAMLNWLPSRSGKYGVRGNIGEAVTITVQSANGEVIRNLSLYVTGAASVTYNGVTSAIIGGQVVIPIQSSSAVTLIFNPAETDRRVEVSTILPGTVLQLNNENIISCIVSLRSDLSIIDPTLPESEINIDVYNNADISDTVAGLPEETPVYYQAGYDSDMSTRRKFYVSGQVTWADNVLSIHAVDAVHRLDVEMFPFMIGSHWSGRYNPEYQQGGLWMLYEAFRDQIMMAQVDHTAESAPVFDYGEESNVYRTLSIVERQNRRDIIANIMNLFHIDRSDLDNGFIFWPTYVDAGIPAVRHTRPNASGDIYEEDCGDVKKEVETQIGRIIYEHGGISATGTSVNVLAGSGTLLHSTRTAFPDYQQLCSGYQLTISKSDGQMAVVESYWDDVGDYSGAPTGLPLSLYDNPGYAVSYGKFLLDNDIGQNGQAAPDWFWGGSNRGRWPWERWSYVTISQSTMNALISGGYINASESASNLDLRGRHFFITKETRTVDSGLDGITARPSITGWNGAVYVFPTEGVTVNVVTEGFNALLRRSPVKGSFTWKGDPRMQPRDVIQFHRLDGSVEQITIETITLKHEGGGTTAEITYRKGVV